MTITVRGSMVVFEPFAVVCEDCKSILDVGAQKDIEVWYGFGDEAVTLMVRCPVCAYNTSIPEALQGKYRPLFAKEIRENLARRV